VDLAAAHGILLLHLPPYSPTFNPIENVFSKFKKYIRRYGNHLQQGVTDEQIIYSAFQSVTQADIAGYFHLCGYFTD